MSNRTRQSNIFTTMRPDWQQYFAGCSSELPHPAVSRPPFEWGSVRTGGCAIAPARWKYRKIARERTRDTANPLYYGPIRQIVAWFTSLYLIWRQMTLWTFHPGINLPQHSVTTGKDDRYKNS